MTKRSFLCPNTEEPCDNPQCTAQRCSMAFETADKLAIRVEVRKESDARRKEEELRMIITAVVSAACRANGSAEPSAELIDKCVKSVRFRRMADGLIGHNLGTIVKLLDEPI